MKKQNTIFIVLTLFIFGCSDSNLEAELAATKAELQVKKQALLTCNSELTDLLNTPENRIVQAQKLFSEGDIIGAQWKLEEVKVKYPNSEHYNTAVKELSQIKAIQKKQQRQLEAEKADLARKKALGFKAIKASSKVNFGNISLSFEKVWTGKRWSFDDHGREYSLRDATRGNKHILARVSISSTSKSPLLPSIIAYEYNDGALQLIGELGYEFRRWKDYGSYLGNYADYGNDFAHSKTVRFNLGYETSETNLKKGRILFQSPN